METPELHVAEFPAQSAPQRAARFTAFLDALAADIYPEPPSSIHEAITESMVKEVLKRTGLTSGATVLDVGCGQGPALDRFRALELDAVGITLGREDQEACLAKGHRVLHMDQSFLEFEKEQFDLVWARHCVEHSIAPLLTLSEFFRVLKPGGWLYLEVPAPDTSCHHEQNPNHYSVLTWSAWTSLLMRSGFQIADARRIPLQTAAGPDEYWTFLCSRGAAGRGTENPRSNGPVQASVAKTALFLGLSQGENFGWGVCSKYLQQELGARLPIQVMRQQKPGSEEIVVSGKALVGLSNPLLSPIVPLRGTETAGYAFFENELLPQAIQNARQYDRFLCGSTWCQEKARSAGILTAEVLIQGIDPSRFFPLPPRQPDGMFVVFSGGKFEFRKGQDLVLRAIQILQQKYRDIVLINSWYNPWLDSMRLMAASRHISFFLEGGSWEELMGLTYERNGLDARRIVTLLQIDHAMMRDLFAKTDLGLFPNRCEGGTNLVLMEYMACGRPVIATYATGHTDILTEDNALLLRDLKSNRLSENGRLFADWVEPSIDEIVAAVEYAYLHREETALRAARGSEDMARRSWGATAERIIQLMGLEGYGSL